MTARYCARRTCSKVLVRRVQESSAQFEARKFCSVKCAEIGKSRTAAHGSWKAVRLHWMRNEKRCVKCQRLVDRELKRTAA